MATELDYMEYSTDALAQAAYVSDAAASVVVDTSFENAPNNADSVYGASGVDEKGAQTFQVTENIVCPRVDVRVGRDSTSPADNFTVRIETTSGGYPTGTLVDANATVTVAGSTLPATWDWFTITFPATFNLSSGTTYAIVMQRSGARDTVNYYIYMILTTGGYANGKYCQMDNGAWGDGSASGDANFKVYKNSTLYLQCYSEATIKQQGTYSLKGVAAITDSLNDTLTRTVSPTVDLTGDGQIKFDVYAGRTGANIKIGIRNTANLVSNADIDDEDMADITDWTDLDSGGGASTQVTFDSKSCMKLDSGGTTGSGNFARRSQDIGSFSGRTIFSMSVYCDLIGARANSDYFEFRAWNGSTRLTIKFASDGLFVYDGVADNEVGTNIVVQDTWQEWTFDVNWTAQTVDVYLGGVLQQADVDCSHTDTVANGTIDFYQYGITTANQITYVDWFKAGSDFVSVGTTTEKTHTITDADTWETDTWDISAVADTSKNAIDRIIITITNADANNTFYIDNMYGEVGAAAGGIMTVRGFYWGDL